jgi:hypothetical protein
MIREKHPFVGARLLTRWRFPEACIVYARSHNDPIRTATAAVIELAYECALIYGYTYPLAKHRPDRLEEALNFLGFERDVVATVTRIITPALNQSLSIKPLF